jgi:hypothetical protein
LVAKIVEPQRDPSGTFVTSTKNTGLSQRETLEEALVNLATLAGASAILRQHNSRGSTFYKVKGVEVHGYQSASNTILELSRLLRARAAGSFKEGA